MHRSLHDHESSSYSDFNGIVHPEEEQTEFVSHPPSDDHEHSPNESIDAQPFRMVTSTPKVRPNRIMRSQSLCVYSDDEKTSPLQSMSMGARTPPQQQQGHEERMRDMEAQVAYYKTKLAQQNSQLRLYEDQIVGLEDVAGKYAALQSGMHKLREENSHVAADLKKAKDALVLAQGEKRDMERLLEGERRKLQAAVDEAKYKEDQLKESERLVTETEISFSQQLHNAEAQIEAMSQSVSDLDRTRMHAQTELSDLRQQLQREIDRLQAAHQHDMLALKDECTQREAALAQRIKDLELAQRDPVLATGFELTRAAPVQASILDELMQADVHEELKKKIKTIESDNAQLRLYIDGLLIRIIERYPQILEK